METDYEAEGLDALAAALVNDREQDRLESLRRTVEVARRILAMREAGERHAAVQAARQPPLVDGLEQLQSSLDTLGISVVESGKSLGVVARTAAELANRVEPGSEVETLCRSQSGALTSILTAMKGNAELAEQARVQFNGVVRAANQTEQRLRLARAAEAAVIDSLEQILGALDDLAGAVGER